MLLEGFCDRADGMATQRPKRTDDEKQRARDFVRYLASLISPDADAYDLADRAGLSRETVRGWWFGSSVPDGIYLLELLRGVGVLDATYRVDAPFRSAAAGASAVAEEIRRAEEQAADLTDQGAPAPRRRRSA